MNTQNPLAALQQWYATQCDGDWEHEFGVEVSTLDNPGWSLVVDLAQTELAARTFDPVTLERSEHDWVHAHVSRGQRLSRDQSRFEGACGPQNLLELVSLFVEWAR